MLTSVNFHQLDSDAARILWIGALLLKTTKQVEAINPPNAQWSLPATLYVPSSPILSATKIKLTPEFHSCKNKIEIYTYLIITSPKCCVYVRLKNGPVKMLAVSNTMNFLHPTEPVTSHILRANLCHFHSTRPSSKNTRLGDTQAMSEMINTRMILSWIVFASV